MDIAEERDRVRAAVDTARAAQAGWHAMTAADRGRVLHRAADGVAARAAELATAITASVGKPIREARAEVARTETVFRFAAGLASAAVGSIWWSEDPTTTITSVRGPLGVVGMITPFNFPIVIPAWKLGPALVAGNSVVWKPAPAGVQPAQLLLEVLADAGLPDSTICLIDGGVEAGKAVVDTGVDAVTFTGSGTVGREVGIRCAALGIPAQLELGGKNSAIVLADADLHQAASDIAQAAFGYAGQKCTATSRVLVAKSVADELFDLLSAETQRFPVGDPFAEETACGPVISDNKADQLRSVTTGLTVQAQSDVPDSGHIVAPRVLIDVDVSHPVWTEELFGPILAVRVVDDFDEAATIVNAGSDGLAASVHTTASAAVQSAIRHLRSGVVAINRPTTGLDAHVPFGGIKGSGSGPREQGPDSLLFFTEERTCYWREQPR